MTIDLKPSKVLDCRNQFCPTPVVRAKLEIDALAGGEILEVLATDPGAEPDFRSWAKWARHELVSASRENGTLRVLIRKGAGEPRQ